MLEQEREDMRRDMMVDDRMREDFDYFVECVGIDIFGTLHMFLKTAEQYGYDRKEVKQYLLENS